MINDQARWPLWPFLPVKKPKDHGWPDLGCVISNGINVGVLPVIFNFSVDNIPTIHNKEELRKYILAEYTTVDEMVADGWVVD